MGDLVESLSDSRIVSAHCCGGERFVAFGGVPSSRGQLCNQTYGASSGAGGSDLKPTDVGRLRPTKAKID